MLVVDPIARNLMAHALGRAVDKAVREHLSGISQEPQITSRIGQTLEETMDGKSILDHQVRIITQDIPDRGSKSLEKAIGADLYVGISVSAGSKEQTKGFLTQAKISNNLKTQTDFDDLEDDCGDMLKRSNASYVWLYEKSGVRVINADRVLNRGSLSPTNLTRRRASTVFARTLECTEGDFDLGLPLVRGTRKKQRAALGEMLEGLRVPKGVGVLIRG